jgi:S-formylglutathione hydrolase
MSANWSQVAIGGKTADVFEPPRPPRFALLYLHGLGLETLVDQPAYTALLERYNVACVCPHGGPSWWGDRPCTEFDASVTPEQYLLREVVPFFQQRWRIAPPGIGLIGISMGGQGALRLAFKHAKIFPAVAGISSALDFHERYGEGLAIDAMYDSREQCRQDTALMHVPPYGYPPHIYFCIDPADLDWYRGNDRLHEKLTALGIAHTADLTTEAGGHSWDYFNHMAEPVIRFLYDALEKLSRTLTVTSLSEGENPP